jgi:hypothetical protein
MRPIAAGGAHQIGPVVQQEGRASRLRYRPQRVDRAPPVVVRHILQPQLHRGHVPGIQGRGQQVGERRGLQLRRRDQIDAAAVRARHADQAFPR